MLKRRLIPKLLYTTLEGRNSRKPALVVTNQYDKRRLIGDPVSQAKIYEAQLVDELLLLNIDSDQINPESLFISTLRSMASELSTPLSVGGGVRSLADIELLLQSGADKVVINTHANLYPKFIDEAALRFGSQCIVVSIDYKFGTEVTEQQVFVRGGKQSINTTLINQAKCMQNNGAGELIISNIMRDGSSLGIDTLPIKNLFEVLTIPLVASCGCGLASHFVDALNTGISGVSAGTYFTHRDQNPLQCRSHISNSGLPIRIGL